MYVNVDHATKSYKKGNTLKSILGVSKTKKRRKQKLDDLIVLNSVNRELVLHGKSKSAIKTYLHKHGMKQISCPANFSLIVSYGTYSKTRGTQSKHARSSFAGGYKKAFYATWGPPPGISHVMEAGVSTKRHYVRIHASQTEHVGQTFEHGSKPKVALQDNAYQTKRITFLRISSRL